MQQMKNNNNKKDQMQMADEVTWRHLERGKLKMLDANPTVKLYLSFSELLTKELPHGKGSFNFSPLWYFPPSMG